MFDKLFEQAIDTESLKPREEIKQKISHFHKRKITFRFISLLLSSDIKFHTTVWAPKNRLSSSLTSNNFYTLNQLVSTLSTRRPVCALSHQLNVSECESECLVLTRFHHIFQVWVGVFVWNFHTIFGKTLKKYTET